MHTKSPFTQLRRVAMTSIRSAGFGFGFGVHAIRYWPVPSRPWLDGRPG
jgi:hypothetical protein